MPLLLLFSGKTYSLIKLNKKDELLILSCVTNAPLSSGIAARTSSIINAMGLLFLKRVINVV